VLYFTTFFDSNYLAKGITLYYSLKEQTKSPFKIYLLCLDEKTFDFFTINKTDFEFIELILIKDIEDSFPELKQVKKNRTLIEYYFTLSPILPLYLLRIYNNDHICSMDADLFFYNNPNSIFEKLTQFSIIITPHKFSKELNDRKKYGLYNVSFQIFKNNNIGIQCLEKWKNNCIDWCYDFYDEKEQRFADQKYLDDWKKEYKNTILILDDSISGLAVWNANNYNLRITDNVFISNDEKVLFYHFHNFKLVTSNIFLNGFNNYKVKRNKTLDFIYQQYYLTLNINIYKYKLQQEHFIRSNKKRLISMLMEDCSFYFFNKFIVHINLKYIPKFIRKLLIKIYG
jgi:hypothetical protein